MRDHFLFAFIVFLAMGQRVFAGEQATAEHPSFSSLPFAAVADPACPVTGYSPPVPVAKEIRVLYFPRIKAGNATQLKSPILHLIFDNAARPNGRRTVPFALREDGVWQATVNIRDDMPQYAVYWVEDRETKFTDTNDGKYYEIPFCNMQGHRSEMSVKLEAESYTGILEPFGVERAANYAKAIEILEDYIRVPARGEFLISSLWRYRLSLLGDTPEGRAALSSEINKFIDDHSADGFGLVDALNFAANQNRIPEETLEKLVKANEAKYPETNPRAFVLMAQALREADTTKRAALLREIVEKYPNSLQVDDAQRILFFTVTDLNQREKLYQQVRAKNPDDAMIPVNMAHAYLDANLKLPEALALLDEAERLFDQNASNKRAKIRYPESEVKNAKGGIAVDRAEILVRLGRAAEAVAILLPRKAEFRRGRSFFVLGNALEATGDAKGAVDAYLEASVRPWNEQEEANKALERLWSRGKMGSKEELQKRIEEKATNNFSANYEVQMVKHAAPEFNLTTTRGEHFSSSQLRGKTVILNFWAVWCGPCLMELKPLQDFQEKHREIVVLTAVAESTKEEELATIIEKRKLASLRVAKAPRQLWDKFGALGVPNTLVIDKAGDVRIQHYGDLLDVSRYLEADLKAISDAEASNPGMTAPIPTPN